MTSPDPVLPKLTLPAACPAPTLLGERAAEVEARVLERLERFVCCESPSGQPEQLAVMADHIASALEAAGATVRRIDAPGCGVHVHARIPGQDDTLEPVLILGHMDTVHPVGTLDTNPFRIENGRAMGPGIYDMKAGIAVAVETLLLLREHGRAPRRPVEVLITCDEETGSSSSRPLIEELARKAAAVLVLEPPLPGGAAKTQRKGVATYFVRVEGRAAHAGVEPEKGRSATVELAHQILHLSALAAPEKGTTVNIGKIKGGTASNVVAAEAHAVVDMRFTSLAEARRMTEAIGALTPVTEGVSITITPIDFRPPMERTEGIVGLYHHAYAVAGALGVTLGEGASGGGSDGCFTAALGVPTLDGLGVDGAGAHTLDEYILTGDIARRTALLTGLLETL